MDQNATPNKSAEPSAPQNSKPSGKWRRRLLYFVVLPCGFLAIAAVSTYYIMRYVAKVRRDEAIAEARALGEPVWFVELKPEPLPSDQDGTPFLLRAIDLHDRVLATGVAHPFYLDESSVFSADKTPPESLFNPEMYSADLALLREQAAAEAEIVELVRQAIEKGRVQLPRDYDAADAFLVGETKTRPRSEILPKQYWDKSRSASVTAIPNRRSISCGSCCNSLIFCERNRPSSHNCRECSPAVWRCKAYVKRLPISN